MGEYEQAVQNQADESVRSTIIDQLKALTQQQSQTGGGSSSGSTTSCCQLITAQVLVQENQLASAYDFIGGSNQLELLSTKCQILLKLDRYDLAQELVTYMKSIDEESIVTQLCSVYIHLATEGRTGANDAEHTINALSEQYGPSTYLLNLAACTYLTKGQYNEAEQKLVECINEYHSTTSTAEGGNTSSPDTFINLITAYVQQNKMKESYQTLEQLKLYYPTHPYHAGMERITTAFDRETLKYKV